MGRNLSLMSLGGGFLLLLISERVLGPGSTLRPIFAALALADLAFALGWRVKAWLGADGERKAVLGKLIPAYAAVLLGVVAYFAQAEGSPLGLEGDAAVYAQVAGLLLCFGGALPALMMELSLQSMAGTEFLEARRVAESGRGGLAIALVLCFAGFANYVGNETSERIDLRTVRDLDPSDSTLQMAANLSKDVTITLFFAPANDVLEQVKPYFDELASAGDRLTVQVLDRDRRPGEAKAMRARKNGTVVFSVGDTHESVALDVDPDKARRKLKKLDSDVQQKLNKVAREQRVAYFTSGHGERSTSPRSDEVGLKIVKESLKQLNYKVKKLGANEGLSNAVPEDATLVVVAAPTGPMLPTEQESIQTYLAAGGAVMVLIDPDIESDSGLGLEPLLGDLGVSFDPGLLAHETKYLTRTRTPADRTFLGTNRFTSHDSSKNLAKNSSRMFVAVDRAGSLSKLEPAPAGVDVEFTVRSMSGTFVDLNEDLAFDNEVEKKGVHQLTAAVTLPPADGAGAAKGGRAIVAADADILADFILKNSTGNQQWFLDGLRWLEDDVNLGGEVAEIEDVAILHSAEQDRLWFWLMTGGMPLALLGVGFAVGPMRRRKS